MKDPESNPGAPLPAPEGQTSAWTPRRRNPPPPPNDTCMTELEAALARTYATQASCEELLVKQAHLLDVLFKRMVLRDIHSGFLFDDGTPRLDDDRLASALRTQHQCRGTVAALSLIRKRAKNAKSD